jgi:hypothetical protein
MKKILLVIIIAFEFIYLNSCDFDAQAILSNKRNEPIKVFTSSPGFLDYGVTNDSILKVIQIDPLKGIYHYQLNAKKEAVVIYAVNWIDADNVPFDTLKIITSSDTITTVGKENIINKFEHVPKTKAIFRYVIF